MYMKLDSQRERVPVVCGESAVKIWPSLDICPDMISVGTHWHEHMEILRVLSGSLELRLNKQCITVNANELAIITPYQLHMVTAGHEGVSYRVVMFDPALFQNATNAATQYLTPITTMKTLFSSSSANAELLQTVDRLVAHRLSGAPYASLLVIGTIYEVIGLLYQHCLEEENNTVISDERLRDVLDFVNAHFCEDISSDSLSQKFRYDEAYFCRRFKAVTGLSPMKYIRILRLEQAQKLLSEGKRSIGDVAAACGFSDSGYFSRQFKAYYGITPGEYSVTGQQARIISVKPSGNSASA